MDERISRLVEQVGLLSVPLQHCQAGGVDRYALLNGRRNNVCIETNTTPESALFRRMAWSSGSNAYLFLENGRCYVYRHNTPKIESYEEKLVTDNAERFFSYLGDSKNDLENLIVPYVLRTYRELRNEFISETSGIDSLNAFLYLLAYSRDGEGLSLDDWGLDENSRLLVQSINSNKWEMIAERFMRGVLFSDKWLQPDIDLLLRHTSGKLFEEANYIAYLPSQLSLFPDERIKYSYDTMQDGAYFTPSFVARSIVEESLRNVSLQEKNSLTIFDPACGASGFLVEALRQLKKANFNKHVKIIGWDKAETAIMMSRFVLNFEKMEWDDTLLTIELSKCDSLESDRAWPTDVDVLLMNPPFLSWDKMKDSPFLRDQLQLILPEIAKPNLSAAFLAKAVDSVSETGVLGAVVPTRLLNDPSYEVLRDLILDRMNLRLVGGLGSYVFESVLAYTSMVVATKGGNDAAATTVLWTRNVSGATEKGLKALRKHRYTNAYCVDTDYSVYETQFIQSQKTWRTNNFQNLELKTKIDAAVQRGVLKKAGELFDIKLGARTGANKVFIVPEDFVFSLPEIERVYFRPSIDNLAIESGYLYKSNYLFYPHTKGLKRIETEDDLRETLPVTYLRLHLPAKSKLCKRDSIRSNPRWWELSEHRSWQEEKKFKLVSTEFGHAGSFSIDYSGEYVVERGNMWELRGKGYRPLMMYYEAYVAFFNSSYMNTLFEIYGAPLAGGGVYKIGKAYVKDIPLPDFSLPLFGEFIPKLSRFAKKMKNDEYWDADELDSLVNEMIKYAEY